MNRSLDVENQNLYDIIVYNIRGIVYATQGNPKFCRKNVLYQA